MLFGSVQPHGELQDLPEAQWGTFLSCQGMLPAMIVKNKGKFVNIGSTAAIRMTFFGDYTCLRLYRTSMARRVFANSSNTA